MDFYLTEMGRTFYEGTMKSIKNGIEKNNEETEALRKTVSELKEQVGELTKAVYDLTEQLKWTK